MIIYTLHVFVRGMSGRVIKVVDSAHIPNPVRCRSDTHLKC